MGGDGIWYEWYGIWDGMGWHGLIYGMDGMVWYGMAWYMGWDGIWYGMVRYGMVPRNISILHTPDVSDPHLIAQMLRGR